VVDNGTEFTAKALGGRGLSPYRQESFGGCSREGASAAVLGSKGKEAGIYGPQGADFHPLPTRGRMCIGSEIAPV